MSLFITSRYRNVYCLHNITFSISRRLWESLTSPMTITYLLSINGNFLSMSTRNQELGFGREHWPGYKDHTKNTVYCVRLKLLNVSMFKILVTYLGTPLSFQVPVVICDVVRWCQGKQSRSWWDVKKTNCSPGGLSYLCYMYHVEWFLTFFSYSTLLNW